MGLTKHLPNAITCMNLVCGMLGMVAVAEGNWQLAPFFIWAGGVFDLFDGLVARALKVHSEIGKQLDSLADMVTFGALPTLLLYQLIDLLAPDTYLRYAAILVAVAAALRLAKFNIDDQQATEFRGLATPAAALLLSGLVFWVKPLTMPQPAVAYALAVGTVAVAALMVSRLRFFAFKLGGHASKTTNVLKVSFLVLAIVAAVLLYEKAIAIIIILYILLSVIGHLVTLKNPS